MSNNKLQIYDIMACNVYVDFDFIVNNEHIPINKKQHKFLIAFLPIDGVFIPDLIEEITGHGPDGYEVKFIQQKFDILNKNGYILDPAFNSCWYMYNLDTGFMKEGEHTIRVKCKNGDVLTKSRYQKTAPGEALLSAYQKNKEKIFMSHKPSLINPMKADTALKDVTINWSTLKDLAGQDAYYIHRLCEGKSSVEFDVQKLVWWDNIFVERYSDARAGFNRNGVVVGKELKPKTSYVYFNEITDSNAMGQTNICIFQTHQVFVTP